MQTKKTVALFSLLLLTSALISNINAAPTDSVVFRGVGVFIELTFPEEAHPLDNIYHNLTITAQTALSSLNITLYIYAPVNSAWQLIDPPQNLPWQFPLTANQSLPAAEILFLLPQSTNGTLRCTLDIHTNQTTNFASFTFYTTQVRTQTYSELLMAYGTLLADYATLNSTYTNLNSNFMSLNSTYNLLIANYTTLNATYASLLTQNSALQTSYNTLTSNYDTLQENLNTLQNNINNLQLNYTALEASRTSLQTLYNSTLNTVNSWQTDYRTLNSTYNNLEAACNTLNATYNNLKGNYATLLEDLTNLTNDKNSELDSYKIVMAIFLAAVVGLIVLIVYIKKKEPEPYMVIRKETVAVKPEEEKKE